jgi:hypothetical protein
VDSVHRTGRETVPEAIAEIVTHELTMSLTMSALRPRTAIHVIRSSFPIISQIILLSDTMKTVRTVIAFMSG